MSAYAIYRLPHEDHATLITQSVGEPMELHSLTELNGKQGFVVAPFEVKADQPVVLIQGKTETIALSNEQLTADDGKNRLPSDMSNYYKVDFANYHSQLEADKFRKIVLARCADERMPNGVKPIDLFYRACQLYPRLFIALVDTEKSGCWLTATPEILLDGHGADWRTIALAGTMKLEGDQLDGEGETLRIFRSSALWPPISPSAWSSLRMISVRRVLALYEPLTWYTCVATLPLSWPTTTK